MKTYTALCALLACMAILGCNTSDEMGEGGSENDDTPMLSSNYVLLLEKEGVLTSNLLYLDEEDLNLVPAQSTFVDTSFPERIHKEGNILNFYQKKGDCTGAATQFDFNSGTSITREVFADLGDCELTVFDLVHNGTTLYLAYEILAGSKTTEFGIRLFDLGAEEPDFLDIPLDIKPLQLVHENGKLFVMAWDEEATRENVLLVMDGETNELVHEMNLGFDAKRLFKTPDKHIIVSYDDLHTIIDSSTMASQFVRYPEGTHPNFSDSDFRYFDSSGLMYYDMLAGTHSIYPKIPAVYDFSTQTAVLYAYENFLTEAQLTFELEIENTTLVHFDGQNNQMLIGYKKSSNPNKGGILRIRPVPDPKYLGNLDLDGVPYLLYQE